VRQTAAKFLPRLLNDNKKQKLFSVYDDLQDQASKDINILSKFITADYTWIYGSGEDSRVSRKFMLNRKWCCAGQHHEAAVPRDAASSVRDTGTSVYKLQRGLLRRGHYRPSTKLT